MYIDDKVLTISAVILIMIGITSLLVERRKQLSEKTMLSYGLANVLTGFTLLIAYYILDSPFLVHLALLSASIGAFIRMRTRKTHSS